MRLQLSIKSLFLVAIIGATACISVPREAAEISETIGKDLVAMHNSYIKLIHTHFNTLRKLSESHLEKVWTPAFLKKFIEEGELIKRAKGEDPTKVLEDVHNWTIVAQELIDKKRKELLSPINTAESKLINAVDSAFYNITRANTSLTSYLRSNERLKKLQDELLTQAQLIELRNSVNDILIDASKRTDKAIRELEKVTESLEDINKK